MLLVVPSAASAQFSPGKKAKDADVLSFRKSKSDTLQVRRSKAVQEKRGVGKSKGYATGQSSKSGVKKSAAAKKGARVKTVKVDSLLYEPVKYRLGDRVILPGDSGADVRNVARILVRKLYMDEDSVIYTKDGGVLYEGELVRAVKRFQRLHDCYEDGIIGHDLIKVLRKRKD